MITIGPIQKEENKVYSNITINKKNTTAYYCVEDNYKDYLVSEVCDAFLIAILPYAIRRGEETIVCESPVSEELLRNLMEDYLPVLVASDSRFHIPSIVCEVIPFKTAGFACGTNASLGVDSLYVVKKYTTEYSGTSRLTHLCTFDSGGIDIYPDRDKTLDAILERNLNVCAELGLKPIHITTNVRDLYKMDYLKKYTFLNLSCIVVTRKMWHNYYYSSSYAWSEGNWPAENIDCTHYDYLTTKMMCGSDFNIYSSPMTLNRFEKVKYLSNYPIAQKYLHTCNVKNDNCSVCKKCRRTLLELDACDSLDGFKERFDVDYYRNNIDSYLEYLCISNKMGDLFSREIFDLMLQKYPMKMSKYQKESDPYTICVKLNRMRKEIRKMKRSSTKEEQSVSDSNDPR